MDCPVCFKTMDPTLSEDKTQTLAWTCATHGPFPIWCVCGTIDETAHDPLCGVAPPVEAYDDFGPDYTQDPGDLAL